MRFPPRLGHLATRRVVAAKLWPTFAEMHDIDEQEALQRLERALAGRLWEDLLEATWSALLEKNKNRKKRLDEDALLEKVAGALKERPFRAGRVAKPTPALSAFLVLADLEAGTLSDAARRALETPAGRQRTTEGLAEAGRFLADELTR
jgi:hypothetical protein